MKPARNTVMVLMLVPIMTIASLTMADPSFEIDWHTINGGGVMFSTGGEFELSGTVGQPDAGGPMVGPAESGFELTGGFWFAQVPGDCVFDGAVNLLDYTTFIDCLVGPSTLLTGGGCACLDLDKDQDVDLFDYRLFQLQFHGP